MSNTLSCIDLRQSNVAALQGGRDKGEASSIGPVLHPLHNGLPCLISQRLPQLLTGAGAELVCAQVLAQAGEEDIGVAALQDQN